MLSDSLPESGASVAVGIVILVAITILLAILVLLLFHMPDFDIREQDVPEIFQIIKIRHVNELGENTLDSYVVVRNAASRNFNSRNLFAKTYRNGILLDCAIPTLNGEDFIAHSHHYNVQYIGGAKGDTWYAGTTIAIDYKDRTFSPGDVVQFEVYDSKTQLIMSRHTFRA